jgi:hypothetical protein
VGPALIPEQRLSSQVVEADFLSPDDLAFGPLVSYEMGGTDINDGSDGLMVKTWTLTYVDPDFILTALGSGPYTLFSFTGVTKVSLAFDQNMRACVSYVRDGVAWIYWYDSLIAGFTHTVVGAGVTDPCVCMDDKRANQIAANDIILAYTKDNNLYFRAQRDRFGVEYLLRNDVNATLMKVGMNRVNRLQFQLEAIV